MRNKYLCKHFNDKLFTQFRLTVNQKVINNSTIIHTNVRNSLILTLNILNKIEITHRIVSEFNFYVYVVIGTLIAETDS